VVVASRAIAARSRESRYRLVGAGRSEARRQAGVEVRLVLVDIGADSAQPLRLERATEPIFVRRGPPGAIRAFDATAMPALS
jgi:hypothetical protein